MGDHPVKVPPELVEEIGRKAAELFTEDEANYLDVFGARHEHIAQFFAQWGADQELEAICETIARRGWSKLAADLRTVRRPKPPSLAEQALASLPEDAGKYDFTAITTPKLSVIRAALTRLAELEAKQ